MDLRVEKTRRSIINGFLELRARKPLEKIRVRELCEKAQINKSTFYDHYRDVYDLAEQLEDEAIRSYLVEHLEQHITLEALSRQYQIPLTTMKACFKSVYGSPVNTYMRALRMDRAALLLRKEPETSVTEIAGAVGYDSASKFAAAFRAVKGQTPLEYRRGGGNPVLSFPDETE